jgi:glucose-6-phosphate 1-dehydrogenase
MEPVWNRHYIDSIQITMAEDFGVQGRGAFYDQTGAIRDVIQNHLFQILSHLAMEPPARTDGESVRDERVKVLKAIPPIESTDVVRGQFRGYRDEKGVAPESMVETFAAVRLTIDSWRWKGVPFYIRAGKHLPATCTEVIGRFRKPPTTLPDDVLTRNHLRFRVSPEMTIAVGATVMAAGEGMKREQVEMVATHHPAHGETDAYELVLADAMAGDVILFARQDYVEEAWRIVDPVLRAATPLYEYGIGAWGPLEVDDIVRPAGGWENPIVSPWRPAASGPAVGNAAS